MAAGVKKAVGAGGTANRWAWFAVPAVAFLLIFFVYPMVEIAARSFADPAPGFGNYAEFFGTGAYVRVLINTLRMAAIVTAVCLLLAYPYAYVMTRVGRVAAGLMLVAVLIPFWSSILVRTYSWTVILQDTGIINSALMGLGLTEQPVALVRNFTGVVIGMVHVLLPFMTLPIYAVMQRIDTDYLKAASNLGASPLRAFRDVFLPLSLPGVYAGSLIVFVISLGFYITPALLGNPQQAMLSQLVVQQVGQLQDWGMGSAMALVLLVVTLVALAVASRVVNVGEAFTGVEDR